MLCHDCYLEAGQHGNLAALECLRRLGVPWGEGLLTKAIEGWALPLPLPLPVVQWLWGQGARISGQQLRAVRQEVGGRRGRDGVEVVEWLERQLTAA